VAILDRAALGLPHASVAAQGVYCLQAAKGLGQGTIVLQGPGVTQAFVTKALPLLGREGIDVNAYVITSCELFDALPGSERNRIFPEARQLEAMGITDFTMATMTRWVRTDHGRFHSLHPFRQGHFLGSGAGAQVMLEAGLDGDSQFEAVRAYVRGR
jgi:transketolase